ncbi:MAG TPA: heparan-alpha-glucosaminide N-acetyltransferase domain-containing protein [Candidatus Sulfotelmatobacter sp.]|jgi:uncharacterized membrane protein
MTVPAAQSRLAYIDWARGLACLLMFQTHCYDSWLSPAARQSRFFMYSQLGGTFPAPLFLFLAGISFALVTEKLWQKSLPPAQIARTTIARGAEIFLYGLLFRLQEYLIAWGWAPKSDLLRVDVLNTIGLSMMLMGAVCWLVSLVCLAAPSLGRSLRQGWQRRTVLSIFTATGTALLISLLTPPLWTTWRPRWLPWPLESYVDGVHNLGVPQANIFPIFPWTGFAFAGLAVGFLLHSQWARSRESRAFLSMGLVGGILIVFARWLDRQPRQFYAVADYWHTSPSFFLIRVGMLLVILSVVYSWCRWGLTSLSKARWGFSPVIQLGQASLLVYWVHLEFVYGRVSILPKRSMGIVGASAGLLVISLAMLALAYVRIRMKGRGEEILAWLRPSPAPAASSTKS